MPDAPDTALVESYLQHLQTQRKLSGHTVENYQRDLMQLGELAREYKRPSLASLSTVDLRRVAAQLHARGMSPSSIARKLSAWRGFVGGPGADQFDGIIHAKSLGQGFRAFRGFDTFRWVDCQSMMNRHPAKKTAPGRQLARNRTGRHAPRM